MAIIKKRDLDYDYTWTSAPGHTPKSQDTLDGHIFDRNDGNSVLSLINSYIEESDITDKRVGLEAESLIKNRMPRNIKTERQAREWLKAELNKEPIDPSF